MLRSLKDLWGYEIHAVDGPIGKIQGFYFDDQDWAVRYLVVDTGNWLFGRQVLLSPVVLGKPDWNSQSLQVDLTQKQVEDSPSILTHQPISRKMESDLHLYYGWQPYWSRGLSPFVADQMANEQELAQQAQDAHLRSSREVIGYHIQARDGDIGHVEDFILDDDGWMIRYLILNTANLIPGKSVMLPPTWIESLDWLEKRVVMDLKRETIRNSPTYDPSTGVNRTDEHQLYDYFGRPNYWD